MALTDEQRKEMYEKLLAEKQGRSGAEIGNIVGGITEGLTNIATAGTGVTGEGVGQSARQIGASQDQAEETKQDRWRRLLKMDAGERETQYQKERDLKGDEFKQAGLDIQKERLAKGDEMDKQRLGIQQGNLELRKQELGQQQKALDERSRRQQVVQDYLRNKLGGKFVEGAPTELNEELLKEQAAEQALEQEKADIAAKIKENPTLTDEGKPMTGEQAKAQGFLQGALDAENVLNTMPAPSSDKLRGREFIESASEIPILGQGLEAGLKFMGSTPEAGSIGYKFTPEEQQYNQAAKQWIMNVLRKESGAAIGKDEYENTYRTYFPVSGDSPEVIQRKAEARKKKLESMRAQSGNLRQKLPWENETK